MTRYEHGFLAKCAQYGVDGRPFLMKLAQSAGESNADRVRREQASAAAARKAQIEEAQAALRALKEESRRAEREAKQDMSYAQGLDEEAARNAKDAVRVQGTKTRSYTEDEYLKKMTDTIAPLKAEIERLRADGNVQAAEALRRQLADATSRLDTLGLNVKALTGERDALNGQLGAANASIKNLTGERDTLTGQLGTANENIKALTGQLGTANENIKALTGERDSARGAVRRHSNRISQLKSDNMALNGQLGAANDNIKALTGDLGAANDNIKALTGDLGAANDNIKALTGQLDTSEKGRRAAINDFNALRDRSGWQDLKAGGKKLFDQAKGWTLDPANRGKVIGIGAGVLAGGALLSYLRNRRRRRQEELRNRLLAQMMKPASAMDSRNARISVAKAAIMTIKKANDQAMQKR